MHTPTRQNRPWSKQLSARPPSSLSRHPPPSSSRSPLSGTPNLSTASRSRSSLGEINSMHTPLRNTRFSSGSYYQPAPGHQSGPSSRPSSRSSLRSTSTVTSNSTMTPQPILRDSTSSLSNPYNQLPTNIQVAIRPRPLSNDAHSSPWSIDTATSRSISNPEVGEFIFDHVFQRNVTNKEVYNVIVKPVIERCFNGYNGTVFAYGMTGSGKTYSMSGLIGYAIEALFDRDLLIVKCSYLEIYNEKLNDLLNEDSRGDDLIIRDDVTEGVKVLGLTEVEVRNQHELLDVIEKGDSIRRTGTTDFNTRSSRSHAVVLIRMTMDDNLGGQFHSTLCFCDLAGSEKATSQLERRKEGSFINKSLLALGTVISKLSQGYSNHIPYRDSKLTRLLQPSLSGNSIVSILCTIHLSTTVMAETVNTLRFALRAKDVTLNARKNEVSGDINPLLKENEKMKFEIEKLKNMLLKKSMLDTNQSLGGEYFELAAENKILNEQLEHYKRLYEHHNMDGYYTSNETFVELAQLENEMSNIIKIPFKECTLKLENIFRGQLIKIDEMKSYISHLEQQIKNYEYDKKKGQAQKDDDDINQDKKKEINLLDKTTEDLVKQQEEEIEELKRSLRNKDSILKAMRSSSNVRNMVSNRRSNNLNDENLKDIESKENQRPIETFIKGIATPDITSNMASDNPYYTNIQSGGMSSKLSKTMSDFTEKDEAAEILTSESSTQKMKQSLSSKYCTKTVEETISELDTNLNSGLGNQQDIIYRRKKYGTNELDTEDDESLLMKFLSTFYSDPMIMLLIGSAAISFLMGNIDDAVSITAAIVIVVTVGFVQEYRSEKSLEALNKLVPEMAHLTRNNATETVLAAHLVPGDLIHFSVGDRIPADTRLTDTVHLTIDESNLTGEAKPAKKSTDAVSNSNSAVNERSNIAFMGTLVREGHGSGIVIATSRNTAFGSVFDMMSNIEKPKTPLQNAMDKLGGQLSVFSFAVIGFIGLIGLFQGRSWLDVFQVSVSLAVAAIPEGLPIIVTVTLALGVLRMAKQKAIVKRLPSVETLGSVNVICSDKTGTLTQNHMTVNKIWTVDMDANTLLVDNNHHYTKEVTKDIKLLLNTGCLCNNAKYSVEKEKFQGNPTDIAIVESLKFFGLYDIRDTVHRVNELPFSSSRKYMAITCHSGDGSNSESFIKGAVERILNMSKTYYTSNGVVEKLTPQISKKISEMADTLASDGLRVLSFAKSNKTFDTEPTNLTFCGLMGMNDPPRPQVKSSINSLMRGGVHVIMITGDSETTALHIAEKIGMPIADRETSILSGDKLDNMSEQELSDAIQYVSVFARTSPEHKLKIVRALQMRGDIVAMTGDGVNDAPALKLADIGIAMGMNGTDVAKEAADMVLTDDDFSTILHAIKEGKGIFNNIQNFLTFQLSTSVAALSLIALATLFNLPNPLNAMQILWINIIMDGPPAQSLGVEPVDQEIMNKPPRARDDNVLTFNVIKRVLQAAVFVIIGTMFVYVREMGDSVTRRDTTMTFTCFVLFDMFNALACRSTTKSTFELGITNTMFNYAVGGSILGQLCAIYVPFFQEIFQTEALSFGDLIYLIAISSSVWIADEVKKYLARKKNLYSFPGYSTLV